ncbi:hypothetical protein DAI22_04g281200 [Oryza sativa Japonica Group]|nr:hypothetical protein DAI22_04g281200 [Oryza sativa Japonica Group]
MSHIPKSQNHMLKKEKEKRWRRRPGSMYAILVIAICKDNFQDPQADHFQSMSK